MSNHEACPEIEEILDKCVGASPVMKALHGMRTSGDWVGLRRSLKEEFKLSNAELTALISWMKKEDGVKVSLVEISATEVVFRDASEEYGDGVKLSDDYLVKSGESIVQTSFVSFRKEEEPYCMMNNSKVYLSKVSQIWAVKKV